MTEAEKMREEFEKWAKSPAPSRGFHGLERPFGNRGDYLRPATQYAWESWQGATQHILATLRDDELQKRDFY